MAYHRYYSKAVFDQVNQESKDLLDDYSLELESNGKSEKTIYQYTIDIKGFMCWVFENQKNTYLLDLKKRDFRKFFLEMKNRGNSPARINRMQSSIRNLLEFATQDDDEYEYDVNAMKAIKGLHKESVRDIVFLSDEQIDILLKYLLDHEDYQKALYVSLSYDSAGRRNEIHQVKKDGFEDESQTNVVIGKRGKKFRLIYFDRTREIAKKWFAQRGSDDVESLWVIRDKDGVHEASYQALYEWALSLRKILKDLTGDELAINSHTFRHSALENYSNGSHYVLKEMGKKELPIDVLKVIAHHSNIDTTQSYLKNHDEDLLEDAFGIQLQDDDE